MSGTSTDSELRVAWAAYRRHARRGTLDTGHYRMRYFTWGDGPPLVFIHGMADTAASFVMVIHRLASRFTCFAYDLPDGLTDGSALGRYRYPDYVADLLALVEHLGLAQTAVLGSSFGSTIALSALATAPHRFRHAILQGAFARHPLQWWQTRLCQLARYWPGWFGSWPAIFAAVMARVERATLDLLTPEVARFFHVRGGRTPSRASALRTLTFSKADLRPLLPTIRTPVLLIGGDRDPLVPRFLERELESGLPDVRRVEFIPCGHYPHFTHPGPMADAISRFLDEGRPLKLPAQSQ